jgi:dsDNA-specific endonuclease/ATPase MutS2
MELFEIGDTVEVLDEAIKGYVVGFNNELVMVETDDGFTMEYEYSQLIKIYGSLKVTHQEVAQNIKEKEIPKKRPTLVPKPKERNAPKLEVDLHIHQLTAFTRGMSNYEMLNLQLDTAKRQLEFAMRKRIQKVVFIHGVGEGVLKEELEYLFKKYDNLQYYDAEYQKYGLGATEVYIFQNT